MATPWEVDTAVYAEKSKDVSTQDISPLGVTFSSDGSKMYIMGRTNKTVYQYTVSTPWDVDTAVYAEKFKYVGDEEMDPYGIAFSSDGTKMYIVGDVTDTIYQYTLSTEWDVSTATYAEKSKYVGDKESWPTGIAFSSDGTKMYIVGGEDSSTAYQYTLSTEWDVSTATYANKSKYVGDEDINSNGIAFSSDGTKMYITGSLHDTVHQYTLSTPWEVDTAVYAEKLKYVGDKETYPWDVAFSPDGTKMYIIGTYTDTVFQYTLPVAPPKVNAIMFGSNF
ncbi:hypothetical protein ES703_18100 [subsurface metagenome]